jgi:hypothetical protein
MLNHDTQLFPHHLDPQRLYDFSAPWASMVRHPTDPGVWGLRNDGGRGWSATRPGGGELMVEPGRTVPLQPGTEIRFGPTTGIVRPGGSRDGHRGPVER